MACRNLVSISKAKKKCFLKNSVLFDVGIVYFCVEWIADRITEFSHAEQYIEIHTTEDRGFRYSSFQFHRFDIGFQVVSGDYGQHRLGLCEGIGSVSTSFSVR